MSTNEVNVQPKPFLNASEVADRYGVNVATIWAWLAEGKLPQPIRITPGTTRWDVRELRRFEKALKAAQIGSIKRTR